MKTISTRGKKKGNKMYEWKTVLPCHTKVNDIFILNRTFSLRYLHPPCLWIGTDA